MKHDALIAWTSLYIAVGALAAICAVLAAIATVDDWRRRRWQPKLETALDAALLLPKVWLRWQVNYLKGVPIIIAIALYYAWYVGFGAFWDL